MSVSTLKTTPRRIRQSRRFIGMAAVGLTFLVGGLAQAQTIVTTGTSGSQVPVGGGEVIRVLLFNAVAQPSDPTQAIPLNTVAFNYIRNPYMAVVQGVSGTYGVSYSEGQIGIANGVTITHNVPGMLSFGNLEGSLRATNDDQRALNGFGDSEFFGGFPDATLFTGGGLPGGFNVWPLPAWWRIDGTTRYDYSSYVSANIDGVQTNGTVTGGTDVEIVGGDAAWRIRPTFRANAGNGIAGDNLLLSEAIIAPNVILRQEVRLFRNTAQLTWQVRNEDTLPHTVYLRFVVNNRDAVQRKVTGATFDPGFFYTDPDVGPTLRSQIYGSNPDGTRVRNIPNQIDVLGYRYQPDTIDVEPFHARYLYNGFGATQPTTVYVGDSGQFLPAQGLPFSPQRSGVRLDKLENGIAVASYYGPLAVAAGSTSAPIVTYFGNGSSTDRLDPDFSIGLEAERALQYNANAVNTITTAQKSNPNLGELAKQFLLPNQLNVIGSIYNRQLSEAQFNITLKDVRMSLTLPDALRFAIDPATGVRDTSAKIVGDIPGDQDGRAQWLVEPTGEQFGTYSYVMTSNVGGISPLSRTIARPVTIPATPLYNVSADYFQQIGFPFEFDPATTNNRDAATILNTLSKPNDTNPGSYVFYDWIPDPDSLTGDGRYVPVNVLERGKAYFYRPALSRLLYLNGAAPDTLATPADPNAPTRFFQKVLERGWNMISDPFVYSVPVSFISFADIDNINPGADLVQTSFANAVATGQVRGGIFFYNPQLNGGAGGYDFFQDLVNQEIKPYQGYWVFLENRKILRIAVPSQKQSAVIPAPDGSIPVTRGKKYAGAIETRAAFPVNQTASNWKLQLAVKQSGADVPNGKTDAATLVGVSAVAKDGDDTTDLPKPPTLVRDYVSMRIMHETKNGTSRAFAQDLKAPGGKKSWDLEVVSDKTGPVTVSWPNLSQLPRSVRLTLTDKQTGRKTSLKSASSVVVNVSSGAPSRFVLTADKQASRQLSFSNVVFKSEGTRSIGGGSSYSLRFKTTADAQVEARVLTLSGKIVSNMDGGRAAVAGSETRILWNGRAQNGSTLPAGAYNIELTARDDDGNLVTELRPVTIIR